jgi:NADPH:quinone reductase-like Zn-dependent oxidoreductase
MARPLWTPAPPVSLAGLSSSSAARGARIIASAASADFGHVRDLGAADAVDRAGDVAAQVKDLVPEGADVTIDLVGPAVWPSALAATRAGGLFITASRSSAVQMAGHGPR